MQLKLNNCFYFYFIQGIVCLCSEDDWIAIHIASDIENVCNNEVHKIQSEGKTVSCSKILY